MFITLLAVLNAPVSSSTPRECRVEDVTILITEEGKERIPRSNWENFVEGCKRNFGPSACPYRIEFNAKTNHTRVHCGKDVNSAAKE